LHPKTASHITCWYVSQPNDRFSKLPTQIVSLVFSHTTDKLEERVQDLSAEPANGLEVTGGLTHFKSKLGRIARTSSAVNR
jgi:hypothetical protein